MGFTVPNISVVFKQKGATVIARSAKGIVALIIKDDTDGAPIKAIYKSIADVDFTKFSKRNFDYINLLYLGAPSKVIVININGKSVTDALNMLASLKFNYLAMPAVSEEEVLTISAWIKSQRDDNKKTFKAVLPKSPSDHEGIINFTGENIKSSVSDDVFNTGEYCVRIAGILAGLPFSRSSTYFKLSDITDMTDVLDANERIKKGELVIIFDGENYKIARGINSFVSHTATKGSDFSKIKVVDGMDLYRDDITDVFENHYVGKYINDYDNKQAFVGAINAYNKSLEGDVLDKSYKNESKIDVEAQKLYLESTGVDTSTMKEMEIKTANTGTNVFVTGNIKLADTMEDLVIVNYL